MTDPRQQTYAAARAAWHAMVRRVIAARLAELEQRSKRDDP